MKRWAPRVHGDGKEIVHTYSLKTPGGHWLLELRVRHRNGTPRVASIEWFEAHPNEWWGVYLWSTTSLFLITSMLLEGRPFMQFVRDYLVQGRGNIREAVGKYATTTAQSVHATEVRDSLCTKTLCAQKPNVHKPMCTKTQRAQKEEPCPNPTST